MLIRSIFCLTAPIFLTACITMQPRIVKILEPFDGVEAAAMLEPGLNTIVGGALMRQRGGAIVTCAGLPVHLVPATNYAKRRMSSIYGSQSVSTDVVRFEPDIPDYSTMVRSTICNVQGQFTFSQVADGDFFISTAVVWSAADMRQGGAIMGRIKVRGGERKEITLAP